MKRKKAIEIRTKDGGVIKVVGSGSETAICFHTGRNPSYNIIDNSEELREFFTKALGFLRHESINCHYCGDDKHMMVSTGEPKHPLRAIPCPYCQGSKSGVVVLATIKPVKTKRAAAGRR